MDECDYYGLVGATYSTTELPRVIMSTGAYNAMALRGLNNYESMAVITTSATRRTSNGFRNGNNVLLMNNSDSAN